jgi:hypothetical protein
MATISLRPVSPTPVHPVRPTHQVVQQVTYTQERAGSIPRIAPDRLDQVIRYSSSPEQRLAAVIQLDEVKNRTVPEVAALAVVATEDPEPEIREAGLWVLERKGASGPEVTAAVRQLCTDSDASVRSRAQKMAKYLGQAPQTGGGSH